MEKDAVTETREVTELHGSFPKMVLVADIGVIVDGKRAGREPTGLSLRDAIPLFNSAASTSVAVTCFARNRSFQAGEVFYFELPTD
jgi:hypothetical protein